MEQLFQTLLTTDMLIVAFAVGSILEIIKQVLMAFKVNNEHPVFKIFMAVFPLPLGALVGWLVVDEGGIADPWVMGAIGGMASSKIYDTIAPGFKAYARNGKNADVNEAPDASDASEEPVESTPPPDDMPDDNAA